MPEQIQYTRKDYMTNVCDHATYYRQFVNPAVIRIVEQGIGRAAILASKDEHLNDIPLAKWDALGRPKMPTSSLIALANGSGFISLSDCVCTFKQAAQMMREGIA